MYQKIISEFSKHPRDIHTIPLKPHTPKWFFVFVKENIVFIEPAHHKMPSSKVKTRKLLETECNEMLEIYHRRLSGEAVSKKAQECTHSQVYWYGIFSEMNL